MVQPVAPPAPSRASGPRRVVTPEEGASRIPPYQIVDTNTETILDLTDIVFIDPSGTGLSETESPDDAKKHYSVKGDIECIAKFIRDYLTQNNRYP